MRQYLNHSIFADLNHKVAARVILESYPLHPVSVFILPRLSERIAQNERTLFTFLSADGTATLRDFCVGMARMIFILLRQTFYLIISIL